MDLATIFGLILAFAFVIAAITLGGDASAFINPPSILIVIGGTFAITTICFSLAEIFRAQKLILNTILFNQPDGSSRSRQLIDIAQKARANGILSVQGDVGSVEDPFLRKALSLAVDGVNPEAIDSFMSSDTGSMLARHQKGAAILKKSAEVAPAMGLIGTLIGLVQMLGNLSEPDKIGPAMAVALLTTLYGAMLANMVFMPLAAKLERNSQEEFRMRRIYHAAVMSIVKQENPRQLEVMINAILPPAERISVFE